MSGVNSISQHSPLQTQASAIEPGSGFLLANAAAIGPALPMDAQLLQVLQRAFPTGSVQGAMSAASPTALAAIKATLGTLAGVSVMGIADWIAGRLTGDIPAGISARDMEFAGNPMVQLSQAAGLNSAEVRGWSDAQKVFFVRSLSALHQAEIYDGLPADQAAGLASRILDLTRNNNLTIPQERTGTPSVPSAQLAQPVTAPSAPDAVPGAIGGVPMEFVTIPGQHASSIEAATEYAYSHAVDMEAATGEKLFAIPIVEPNGQLMLAVVPFERSTELMNRALATGSLTQNMLDRFYQQLQVIDQRISRMVVGGGMALPAPEGVRPE